MSMHEDIALGQSISSEREKGRQIPNTDPICLLYRRNELNRLIIIDCVFRCSHCDCVFRYSQEF